MPHSKHVHHIESLDANISCSIIFETLEGSELGAMVKFLSSENPILIKNNTDIKLVPPPGRNLYTTHGAIDRSTLDSLWVINNYENDSNSEIYCINKEKKALSQTRLQNVRPFVDHNILGLSQGPKGRWN